ncbi:MAG: hypothetical protein AAF244_03460, partial [Pseudomonadota bacterium]
MSFATIKNYPITAESRTPIETFTTRVDPVSAPLSYTLDSMLSDQSLSTERPRNRLREKQFCKAKRIKWWSCRVLPPGPRT